MQPPQYKHSISTSEWLLNQWVIAQPASDCAQPASDCAQPASDCSKSECILAQPMSDFCVIIPTKPLSKLVSTYKVGCVQDDLVLFSPSSKGLSEFLHRWQSYGLDSRPVVPKLFLLVAPWLIWSTLAVPPPSFTQVTSSRIEKIIKI